MSCEMPRINSNKDEIKAIFNSTKTIAVVGCSPDSSKPSNIVAKYLKDKGFKIVPVYPKEETILGEKVYKNLSEIPFEVDLVDIFRKPDAVEKIVDAALSRGDVKTIWTQLGIVNNEATQKAKDAGLNVVQNRCTKIEYEALIG